MSSGRRAPLKTYYFERFCHMLCLKFSCSCHQLLFCHLSAKWSKHIDQYYMTSLEVGTHETSSTTTQIGLVDYIPCQPRFPRVVVGTFYIRHAKSSSLCVGHPVILTGQGGELKKYERRGGFRIRLVLVHPGSTVVPGCVRTSRVYTTPGKSMLWLVGWLVDMYNKYSIRFKL